MRGGLGKDRHRRVRGKNAAAVARKNVRTLVLFVSFRVAVKTASPVGETRKQCPIVRPKSTVTVRAEDFLLYYLARRF